MRKNNVSIKSVLNNGSSEEIIAFNENMILVKIDFNNVEYSFWLNEVTEKSYSIGNSNVTVNQDFYSDLFEILKKNRDDIEEAKNKILDLFISYN